MIGVRENVHAMYIILLTGCIIYLIAIILTIFLVIVQKKRLTYEYYLLFYETLIRLNHDYLLGI